MTELPPAPEETKANDNQSSQSKRTDPKDIRRDTDNAYVAGVAAGIGKHFGIDPNVIRVGLVIAVFFGGIGIVGYLAAWILIPDNNADSSEDIADRFAANWPWLAVGGLAFAFITGIGANNDGPGFGILGLLLVAAGVYLIISQRRKPLSATAKAEARANAEAEAKTRTQSAMDDFGASAKAASDDMTNWVNDYNEKRAKKKVEKWSPLGSITFGIMLIVGAVLVYLSRSEQLDLTVREIIGYELIIVGVSALIATFFGRTRDYFSWIPILIVLAVIFGNNNIGTDFGDRTITPATTSSVLPKYELGIGTLTLDLRNVDVADGQTLEIETNVGVGGTVVYVPRGDRINGSAQVGLGNVTVLDQRDDGPGASMTTQNDVGEEDGELRIVAHNGIGQIEIKYVGDN